MLDYAAPEALMRFAALIAVAALAAAQPNPYRTIEGWAKMPDGRTWGATSAVYGGAVHPSAEGHAAMADAAAPAAAAVLQLDAVAPEAISQPVAPLEGR